VVVCNNVGGILMFIVTQIGLFVVADRLVELFCTYIKCSTKLSVYALKKATGIRIGALFIQHKPRKYGNRYTLIEKNLA
jgi:hypothetical protein